MYNTCSIKLKSFWCTDLIKGTEKCTVSIELASEAMVYTILKSDSFEGEKYWFFVRDIQKTC